MRATAAIITLATLALLTACSASVQESELYGSYVATFKNGSETVTLQNDGTFRQEVRPDASEAVVNSGTWMHDRSHNEVVLRNCLGVTDGFGRIVQNLATQRFVCGLEIGRRWGFLGQLRLGGDESPAPLWNVD
jgi:hypothetical protein